jgi:hypothetical protein
MRIARKRLCKNLFMAECSRSQKRIDGNGLIDVCSLHGAAIRGSMPSHPHKRGRA